MTNITIGIDVSKSFLDVYDSQRKSHKRYPNTDRGVQELLDEYQAYDPSLCHMILESTGIYQRRVQYAATLREMRVYVVNPRWVRQFARSCGRLAKNDRLDAKMLCTYGQKVDLRSVFPRSASILKLADYLRLRNHLLTLKRSHLNHLETQDNPDIHQLIQATIDSLNAQLKNCDKAIKELVKSDKDLGQKQAILVTAPGVGEIISWHLLAFLPELGQVSRKEIASLIGLAPMVCESGSYKGAARIQGGRVWIKNALYMGIMSTIRYSRKFANMYARLKNKGKASKIAMVACMRCLAVCLNIMMKEQTVWQER